MAQEPRHPGPSPWSRSSVAGVDTSIAGAGGPPPARTADALIELRQVTNMALEQVQDVTDLLADVTRMLADAHSARPGSLAQITVAVRTLRHVADELESLTRRKPGERAPGRCAR